MDMLGLKICSFRRLSAIKVALEPVLIIGLWRDNTTIHTGAENSHEFVNMYYMIYTV